MSEPTATLTAGGVAVVLTGRDAELLALFVACLPDLRTLRTGSVIIHVAPKEASVERHERVGRRALRAA